jgi:hypothetical protein
VEYDRRKQSADTNYATGKIGYPAVANASLVIFEDNAVSTSIYGRTQSPHEEDN